MRQWKDDNPEDEAKVYVYTGKYFVGKHHGRISVHNL